MLAVITGLCLSQGVDRIVARSVGIFLGSAGEWCLLDTEANTSDLEKVETWKVEFSIPTVLAVSRAGAITRLSVRVASFDILDGNIIAGITFTACVNVDFEAISVLFGWGHLAGAAAIVVDKSCNNVVVILS